MKNLLFQNAPATMGTIGGTVTGLCNVVAGSDILHSTIMSGIGAAVSFLISWCLNRLLKKKKDA